MMIALFTFIFLLLNTSKSYGIDEFTTNQEINYQFEESGAATISHRINIINNFSQFYPKEYSLSLSGTKATDIQAFDDNGNIPLNITQTENNIKLTLNPQNPKIGKDQITKFDINYHSQTLTQKKGKTWEISLPQFQESLDANTNVHIDIPKSFGKLSSAPNGAVVTITPQGTKIDISKIDPNYKFILTFGDYQLFNFKLNFHLQNPSDQSGYMSVPLPPDTANQKVYFDKIDPRPEKIEADNDGNWIAFYLMSPQTSTDIEVSGQAKIGQNPHYTYNAPKLLISQLYWPTDNAQITKLAQIYTTPRQIYDYVVTTLSYDYNRFNSSSRRGALGALESPSTSLCTDFTDLFVTIARSAGIGAREIEGYAYSNNTNIKPLPIGTDILHAWPEYLDPTTRKWIPIDPTWAKTTGGIDFFKDLDLNHFTLVIHNQKSDSPPPPGSYKTNPTQKTIDISFADSEITTDTIKPTIKSQFNPFSKSTITIRNPNLFSLDSFTIQDSSPQNVLPLQEIKIDFPRVSFLSSLLTQNQYITLTFSYNNQTPETVRIQNPYHFFNLFIVIISGLILLSIGAIILLHHK